MVSITQWLKVKVLGGQPNISMVWMWFVTLRFMSLKVGLLCDHAEMLKALRAHLGEGDSVLEATLLLY